MSRSRTRCHRWRVAPSEKREKRLANRRLRHRIREALGRGQHALPLLREVANRWSWPKDGGSGFMFPWEAVEWYPRSPYWSRMK